MILNSLTLDWTQKICVMRATGEECKAVIEGRGRLSQWAVVVAAAAVNQRLEASREAGEVC